MARAAATSPVRAGAHAQRLHLAGGGVDARPALAADLIYPARGIAGLWQAPPARPPAALGRLLGRTRAGLLLALAEPASTTTLARRLGQSPAAVSEHLSVLRDAGLLTSHRVRRQVLYERTPLGIAVAGAAERGSDPAG